MRTFIALIFVLAIAIVAAPPLRSIADTLSSANFTIQDAFVGTFGGVATSTDFQIVNGGSPAVMDNNATSTNFNAHPGPVNFSQFAPQSEGWRWFSDANDETPTTSLAAENISPSNVPPVTPIKLRFVIKETGGLSGEDNVKFLLQFARSSDFSAGLGTVVEIGSCAATSSWCYASGAGVDNAYISTKVLPDADTCSSGTGPGCGTHNTSGVSTSSASQGTGTAAEYEFTVESSGASVGTTYFFRAVNAADGTPVSATATSSYPSLVTQGATLSFSVSGLPQGTTTASVTTNVSTTATSIPFGTLPVGSSLTGAQRFSVSTNAQAGYELYALQDAPLTDNRGDRIPAIPATNASPLPWGSACTSTSTACYGYHPGSPVLSGGSTRFAADDTYAAFTTSTAEVGYSSLPTNSSTIDMVYRIQIAPTQYTGAYTQNLVYVVAPSY